MEKTDSPPNWIRDLPNQLTLFRVAVVPLLLVLYPLNFSSLNLFCAVLFTLAAITDWLDGFIARKFAVESRLGAILDPVADKMLTASALVLVAHSGAIWAWMAGILLCREIAISGIRLVAQQQGITIKVSSLGKWKPLFLEIALVCLLVNTQLFGWPFREVGMLSIWAALFFSLYSAYLYVTGFWKEFNSN